MILYEFEGKKLLKDAGINVPDSQLIEAHDLDRLPRELKFARNDGYVLKAQVLSGKRAESGGIIRVQSQESRVKEELQKLFGKIINKEKVERVLIEELVEYAGPEYYASLSYDTETRGPILTISESGGTGIEDRGVKTYPIDPIKPTEILKQVQDDTALPIELLEKLVLVFFEQDCLLLEINPLVQSGENWVALDVKVKLDDSAASRHEEWDFPPRSAPGHTPSENEIEAKKIDQGDYRGVAGSTYFDLDGDIAVLSSGGGVSLTAMDALIKEGGKPANFTEYSGNPPKEKVVKLTKIVLNKPKIHGLWVIGTVAANFTDIYETLSGFVEGLRQAQAELQKKFDFPIVIRRGGPRDEEAFEMLRQVKDFNLILQSEETSIASSAKTMAKEAKKYAATA